VIDRTSSLDDFQEIRPMTTEANGRRAALVTGASGGIGAELARLFARDGWDVVLVARSREGLEKVGRELSQAYGITHHVVPADLSDPVAPQAVFAAVRALGVDVDALVKQRRVRPRRSVRGRRPRRAD
jgi:short-subunit dehydrogenase